MIQQTSLNAFSTLDLSRKETQKMKILNYLAMYSELTNLMISKITGYPINIVTARIYELRQEFKVQESKTAPCAITGKLAKYWKVKGGNLIDDR